MTTLSTPSRILGLALLTGVPALAQSVTGTVTAATQLIVSAGPTPANTNTRPAGTNLNAGLNLGTSYQSGPIFVTVNSVFGRSTTSSSITHTINESMTGVNAPVSAGPHATLLTLTASQPVVGTLTVQYSPGATGSGRSSTASIDIGNNGTTEWSWSSSTSQTFQQEVTVSGSLAIRVSTAMVSTAHSLSVQFANWVPLPQLPLLNPSFENGLTGWQTFGNVFAAAAAPPAVDPRTGTGVCKAFGNFTSVLNVSGAFQRFAASPGETYALDCYARHWSGDPLFGRGTSSNHAVKKIVFLDALGIEIGASENLVLDGSMPTDTWVHVPTVVATAPAGTVAVQPTLMFLQWVGASGAAQFDDVAFARVDGCGTFALPMASAASSATRASVFTLEVTAANGVRLCGIDLTQAFLAAGIPFGATVYLHRSLTDYTQYVAAQSSARDWCALATVHGVSAGQGVATALGFTNATNSIELPPGQYLLAIVCDAPTGFPYASGNLTVADAGGNLTLRGGRIGNDLGGASFLGCIGGALHFEILSTPATMSACAAESIAVGTPCGGEPNSVFEVFGVDGNPWDLAGRDLVVTGNGTGASLSTAPATALASPSNAVPLVGDVSAPIPLGFHLGAFGLPGVTDFRICRHGSIFFGGVGNTSGVDLDAGRAPGLMSNDGVARLAAFWNHYDNSGAYYADVTPGVEAVVTFLSMWDLLFVETRSFQVVITPTTMRVRYLSGTFALGMVGFHNGIALPAPPTVGRVDVSAGPSLFTSPNPTADVTLAVLSRPLLGQNFDFRLDDCPPISLVFFDYAQAGAGVTLPTPMFADRCKLYVSTSPALSMTMSPGIVASVLVPNDAALLGFLFALQGGGLLQSGRIAASNAYDGMVGNW